VDTGFEEVDDEANSYPEEREGNQTRYKLDGDSRPKSAQPKRNQTSVPQPKRPASAQNGPQKSRRNFKPVNANPTSLSYPSARKAPTPPKPGIDVTGAYKNVKYQQNSWDSFAEYVWDKLNEEEAEHDEYLSHAYDEMKKKEAEEEKETDAVAESEEKIDGTQPPENDEAANEETEQAMVEEEEPEASTSEVDGDLNSSKKHVHFAETAVEIHVDPDSEVMDQESCVNMAENLEPLSVADDNGNPKEDSEAKVEGQGEELKDDF
jgi:hypothetical protein